MCVIVQYLCPKCKKETGQRDYLCHTDGQRFAIPDPKSKSIPHHILILQSQTSSSKPMCNFFPAMKPGLAHAAHLVANVQQRPFHFIIPSSN